MALPQQPPLIIIDNDENNDNQRLTDHQLLSQTARYLSILEQRVHDQYHNIKPHEVQVLATRRQMLAFLRTILNKSHHLVHSGIAKGFVFGLITENKIWTASSDNLRSWWKEDVDFEQNGPRALVSQNALETLELESLKELQDSTLSSIISALMRKCKPSQRSCPFHLGKPIGWWPTGTEEWWSQLNFPEDIGTPEYRKPHDLKKQWKVAVLIAAIKNLEPDFHKIRRLVCESQTVQNKMTHRENSIWLAVIRGEEMEMRRKLQLSDPESDISNVDVKVLGSASTESNTVDEVREVCLVPPSLIKVESSDIADKETETLPSSSLLKGESSVNKLKRTAITESEIIPIRSSTLSQGPISETFSAAASEGESSKRQKLKGIAVAEPEILNLPNYQNNSCWESSNVSQGSMNVNHQFLPRFHTNSMLHPNCASANGMLHPSYASAVNHHMSNCAPCPSSTAFTMTYVEPGCFGAPASLSSNNNQVSFSSFGGQLSNSSQVNSSNLGGRIWNNHVNSYNFGGQLSNNNQVNSSNFAGRMLNDNQVNSFNFGGPMPSKNQVNSCNVGGQIPSNNQVSSSSFGRQMSNGSHVNSSDCGEQISSNNHVNPYNFGRQMPNNIQLNSSNFGGQISNYSDSSTNGMNMSSSLNVPSIPQSSNFNQPRNDQELMAERPEMRMTSSADSTMPELELDGTDFEFTPFAGSNVTADFNFDLDCCPEARR